MDYFFSSCFFSPAKLSREKVDLANEEAQSQRVLGALLIVLTVGLLILAVVECLWEARRLSQDDKDDADDGHVFLRRREKDQKTKDRAGDDKFKTGGSLYAPKLLDVPQNRVSSQLILRCFRAVLGVCARVFFLSLLF